ncbi:SH3-like domain-containing protein [Jannaschia pohangensis]|uniref:Nitrile hydratase beta subunit n=1 Tax=Jannaschia pohangensis TaxID=390807 RepID=A0A1I3IBE1_9RHOB|nr:SH3-like domain-containing protein [Jannaschia pohangensis]SFI45262.1 Nitrile hydratase beta subunit [Jannaschia pohangensis]
MTEPFDGKRWHDMGGAVAHPLMGPMPGDDHDFAIWEKRVDALVILSGLKGAFTVDGLRRVLEDMGEEAFETMTYYERWVASLNQNLLEAGTYSVAELAERMDAVRARGTTYGAASDAGV